MPFSYRRWIVFLAILFCFCRWEARAQLRFEPILVRSNLVKLTLLGESGGSYAIEGSHDLANWSTLFTGVAEGGRLEVETDVDVATRMFYRARPDSGGVEPIDVTPSFQTNFALATLATAGASQRTLYAEDGTEFTLRFPSNTVAESLPVTMTLVTNISGLPFSGPLVGAVLIQFDDEQLIGAAVLTISFTNVDRRKVISFTSNLDGTDLTLTPDRVGTNRLMMPVNHSGIFGSSLGTTQEVAEVLQTISTNVVEGLSAPGEGKMRSQSILGTSRLCFPQSITRALAVRNRISRVRRQLEARLAAQLVAERQAQLTGETGDGNGVLSTAGQLACEFYNQFIEPYWSEASQNCALMSILMQLAVGLERQLQLLGVPDGERCTGNIFSPERLCPAFQNCLQEIKACCSAGHPGRARKIDIVTLSREQALLGMSGEKALGCWDLGDDKVEEAMDVCTPRIWSGSIKVKETGDFYEHTLSVNGFREVTRTFSLNYTGFIDEAAEVNLGHLGVQVDLKFDGTLIVHEFSEDKNVYWNQCGRGINSFTSEGSVSESGYYVMNLNVQTNGSYGLALGFIGKNKDREPVQGQELEITIGTTPAGIGCNPPMRQTMDSRRETQFFSSPGTFFNGISGNMNRIEGKQTIPGFGGAVESTVVIEWHLTRRVRQ